MVEALSSKAGFQDEKLNGQAVAAIASWREAKHKESSAKKKTKIKSKNNF